MAAQHHMRLERLKLALAFSASAELLRLALPLHRLFAGDAALPVKAGMAPTRAEGLTRIRNGRRQFRAAARVAAAMAKRLGHCRTNFGRCRARDRPVISSGSMGSAPISEGPESAASPPRPTWNRPSSHSILPAGRAA